MNLPIKTFNSRDEACLEVASIIAARVNAVLSKQQRKPRAANIMLSGGSTPVQCYRLLSGLASGPSKPGLSEPVHDWSRVNITLTDERIITPPNDGGEVEDARNYLMLQDHLFQGSVKDANFLPLGDATLNKLNQEGLDFALLGMGEDGHFASIFPDTILDAELTKQLLDPEAAPNFMEITTNANQYRQRITANLALIMKASIIVVLVFGDKKREVLENPYKPADKSIKLPIAYLNRIPAIQIFWAP